MRTDIRVRWLAPLVSLVLAAACGLPRDADGTLERIRARREIRVGVAEHELWSTDSAGRVTGVEVTLVDDIARRVGARPRWVRGAASELLDALKRRDLDLVIGGLEGTSPYRAELGFTRPYYVDTAVVLGRATGEVRETPRVMAVAPGENAWMLEVERALRARESEIPAMVRAAREAHAARAARQTR